MLKNLIKLWSKALVFLLVFSFFFSPLIPILAQESSSEPARESEEPDPDPSNLVEEVIITSPEAMSEVLELPAEIAILPEIFKKDNSLSPEEQLARVREHLVNNNLPVALERLDEFEAELAAGPEREGFFMSAWNSITNNTEEDKEREEAEELAKQTPFEVETFEGEIETKDAEDYEDDFSEAKEQRDLIQKVKNLWQDGTFIDSDETEKEDGIISRLLGPEKAIAEVSDDPDDYLAAGSEITFSQAIQDQAAALGNDPLKILNFVRNEVEYVPYYGSKKGADATLVELAGNDMDQASLLVAMLRESGIPARYRHVDAKMDISTVTDLLGVDSADAASRVLIVQKIPHARYVDENDEPVFFVVEHVYVEAYMPYGYSRGLDVNDGGTPQWVPMDPSMNAYYYEQLVDVVGLMKDNGFVIENFFEDYLEGNYQDLEPLEAFKSEVETYLAAHAPEYFPDLSYEEALTQVYPRIQNFEFIPGTLPYEISANLNTYDYIPSSLRHKITFNLKDSNNNQVLNYTAYVSDLADKEVLINYDAATPEDQTTIDSFDTIYDVVPLSIVDVKPVIKINGQAAATGGTAVTLGKSQKYTMDFKEPRRVFGGPVTEAVSDTQGNNLVTGGTEAIAFNTDRVVPTEIRAPEDSESDSYLSEQLLYGSALDYLDRLQYTHQELNAIIGIDFTHVATSAAISNGIAVTNQGGQPYSFDWKGLRINAFSNVRYFGRFDESANTHGKEFWAIFGLQGSQDESDIFEDNFEVEAVATVKGLRMVSNGEFANTTMKKITEANENEIDSLNISSATKAVFHAAIDEGNIIYTPSKPVTYGQWQGLFYIAIDFEGGDSSYTIGEGLNGGFSACSMPGVGGTLCNWTQNVIDTLLPKAQASGWNAEFISVSPVSTFVGQTVTVVIKYTKGTGSYFKNLYFKVTKPGTQKIHTKNGIIKTTTVIVNDLCIFGTKNCQYDVFINDNAGNYNVPGGVIKAIIEKETKFNPKRMRYEPGRDYSDYSGTSQVARDRITSLPYKNFAIAGHHATTSVYPNVVSINVGSMLASLDPDYKTLVRSYAADSNPGWNLRTIYYQDYNGDNDITFEDLFQKDIHTPKGTQGWQDIYNSLPAKNFTPQVVLSSSYGLMQTMYLESTQAENQFGHKIMTINNSPYDLADSSRMGIEVGAAILKDKFQSLIENDKCAGWSQVVKSYNGGGNKAEIYKTEVCRIFNSLYKEIQ